MYVGVLLTMWATPRMTVGHMVLAASMTVYVLVAMRYEERDPSVMRDALEGDEKG